MWVRNEYVKGYIEHEKRNSKYLTRLEFHTEKPNVTYLAADVAEEEEVKNMAKNLNPKYIKITISDDIFGTECATVLEKILDISFGIAQGLRYGENFQAVLLSNSNREMRQYTHHRKRY